MKAWDGGDQRCQTRPTGTRSLRMVPATVRSVGNGTTLTTLTAGSLTSILPSSRT